MCLIKSFASILPRLFSELSVLIVKKDTEQSHQDFRVHRFVVQEALTWLLQNLLFAALAPNGACVTLVYYGEVNEHERVCGLSLGRCGPQ